jgi:hypothetical protein
LSLARALFSSHIAAPLAMPGACVLSQARVVFASRAWTRSWRDVRRVDVLGGGGGGGGARRYEVALFFEIARFLSGARGEGNGALEDIVDS